MPYVESHGSSQAKSLGSQVSRWLFIESSLRLSEISNDKLNSFRTQASSEGLVNSWSEPGALHAHYTHWGRWYN